MGTLFDNFKYEPGGSTTLASSVCFFIKEQIVFGRMKGGERLPTMNEISKVTGLSFFQTRNVDSRRVVLSAYWSSTLFRVWKPELQVRFSKPFVNYGGKTYNHPRCYFEMSHILELTPTFKVNCEVDYYTAGNSISEPSYNYADFYAELGCVKTFWNDRLRLNLTVTNLFNTSRERWGLDTNGIIFEKWNDDGRRTFMLSVTYRFNQSKSKYKGTASTSELNRL